MADLTRTVAIIFQGVDNNLRQTTEQVEGSLRGIATAANTASPALDGTADASSRLNTAAGSTAGTIGDLTRVMQALAGSIIVKEFVDANVAIENFGRAMTLVTGSTEGAADSLDYVKRISNTLGLEISGAADNFVSLSAAARGTTLEGQATRDIFEAVSKAMALLGKSSADTSGALTAIQQIISKGTVSSEELRGQLGERLPGAFQIAARAIGVTTAELGKLLEGGNVIAADFLPKFAEELNKTFGDTNYVTTFNAELNRLINSFKELAVAGGDTGLFGALTQGLVDVANITKSTVIEVNLIGSAISATRNFLASGGEDWDGYKDALRRASIEAGIAQNEFFKTNESLAETARLARSGSKDLIDWSAQINESAAETKRLGLDGTAQTEELVNAYKKLGFTAKSIGADFVAAFDTIVKSADSTGDEISKALRIVIPKIDNTQELESVVLSLQKAAEDGKITWARYGVEVDKASEAFLKNTGYVKENATEVKKQADATEKAKENAAKLALELEKLASNERIKSMEFKVQFDIAKLQEDTKRVQAAFDAINNTMESTGDVISSALGLLKDFDSLDWGAIRVIEDQLEKENAIRRENFDLQKKLTEAQIENLRAQSQQLQSGDALIKIDGAGLQPHLEAFMFEILKAVQVKVNRDGLPFLLGI
ncbi:tail tape measure [Caudoviricetes sp.]|nr:tail tape measure [Caudoviricetes sp.]